ncbi:hypothetical protein Fmac_019416 [Flemingia macrophylla]|uniref:Uncharacterized protein n=1 Tax=Flemingia macrophylla TaxID=520843 RepID=A0ABD1M9P7_9FABA
MEAFSSAKREGGMKRKVRFDLQNNRGSDGGSRSGSLRLRIRVVVSKEELKRMLRNINESDTQHTSLEQLLSDMVLRDKRVSQIGKYGGSINSWRPALESIPEDRSQ